MASVNEVGRALKIIKASCAKSEEMRPETEALYAMRLRDGDGQLLEAAVLKLIDAFVPTSARPFPSLAEIKEAARSLLPNGRFDPELVWAEITTQIRAVGYTGTPVFSDPLMLRAIEGAMGSWDALCAAKIDDRVANRSRIIQAYQALLRRAHDDALLTPRIRELVAAYQAKQEAKRIAVK